MLLRIGRQALGETPKSLAQDFQIVPSKNWDIRITHKSGGLKKTWNMQQDDNPIRRIKIELNKHLSGSGSIDFAFLDFPVDSGDVVELFWEGDLKYKAFVDVTLDPKGGTAKLIPFSQRFQELFDNTAFTGKTVKEILKTIIENNSADSGITWNDFYVNEQNTNVFTKDYSGYETMKKIIDENVNNYDDRNWGVTPFGVFTIYEPNTSVDQTFLYGDNPAYQEITFKKDVRKVKATRYQVFKKEAGSGQTARAGQVGYGAPYPVLDIENDLRKMVKKLIVSELLSNNTAALDNAYAQLKAQATIPEIIKAKEFDIDRYFPVIGERIILEDKPEDIRKIIINCDSLTNDDNSINPTGSWTGGVIDTARVEGSGSVQFTSGSLVYNFAQPMRLLTASKIGFMIKGSVDGSYITMKINGMGWGSGSWGLGAWGIQRAATMFTEVINISTSEVWEFKQYAINLDYITSIEFQFNQVISRTVNIDRIELFGLFKQKYEANIVQADFEITKDGTKLDLTLNDYDVFANDEAFRNRLNVERLEAVSQDT